MDSMEAPRYPSRPKTLRATSRSWARRAAAGRRAPPAPTGLFNSDSPPLKSMAPERMLPFSRLLVGNYRSAWYRTDVHRSGKDGAMIGFTLDEDQVAAQKWVREFAQKEIRPAAPHYDETEEFPWPVLKKAAEIGLYGRDYYQMVASDDTGVLQPALVEELCWGCAGISLAILGTGLPLVALMAQGTPEQIGRFVPEMFGTAGDPRVGAFAVTEPGAGSDVSSLRTRARPVSSSRPAPPGCGRARRSASSGSARPTPPRSCSTTAASRPTACSAGRSGSTPSWPAPATSGRAEAPGRWPRSRRRARSWGRRRSASRGRRSSSRATTPASGCSSASRSLRSRGSPSSWRTWPPTSTRPGCWSGVPRGWVATGTPSPAPRGRCPS